MLAGSGDYVRGISHGELLVLLMASAQAGWDEAVAARPAEYVPSWKQPLDCNLTRNCGTCKTCIAYSRGY